MCLDGCRPVAGRSWRCPPWPRTSGQSGTDFWRTAGDGLTFTSFDKDPIPAGFFCPGSPAYTERIRLAGGRLATEPAGSLGRVDTVVHRLKDVVLDENGVGLTPIKLLALALETREPIVTSCGSYDVKVALAGEQPTTWMKIVKTSEYGGTYAAPLALDVRVVFEPVAGNPNPRMELLREVRLGPDNHAVWAWQDPGEHEAVKVDTDGDGTPDAFLPQPSNFLAGVAPVATSRAARAGAPGPWRRPMARCPSARRVSAPTSPATATRTRTTGTPRTRTTAATTTTVTASGCACSPEASRAPRRAARWPSTSRSTRPADPPALGRRSSRPPPAGPGLAPPRH